jgi:heme-degrading monooxygenase HmoA
MYFTHGRWSVRNGHEAAFASAWQQFARWMTEEFAGNVGPILLRDRENPRQFFSFNPWDTLEAIADFNSRPELGEFQVRVRPMLDGIEMFALDLVTGDGTGGRADPRGRVGSR